MLLQPQWAPPKVPQRCFTSRTARRSHAARGHWPQRGKKKRGDPITIGWTWNILESWGIDVWTKRLHYTDTGMNFRLANRQFDLRTCSVQTSKRYERREKSRAWLGGSGPSLKIQTSKPSGHAQHIFTHPAALGDCHPPVRGSSQSEISCTTIKIVELSEHVYCACTYNS